MANIAREIYIYLAMVVMVIAMTVKISTSSQEIKRLEQTLAATESKLMESETELVAMRKASIEQLALTMQQQDTIDKIYLEYAELSKKKADSKETVLKTVEVIVEKPVYTNECIDVEGLQFLNSIIEGKHET